MGRESNDSAAQDLPQMESLCEYWNQNPFEYKISKSPSGTIDYFHDVELYYSTKYSYIKKYIDYSTLCGKKGLDIGCGVGNDLVKLSKAGALVTGVDISDFAVEMAKKNLGIRHLNAEVLREDGENLKYDDNSFDFIFCISTVSYTRNPKTMVNEIHRMLKQGAIAYFTVYNKNSWLNILYGVFNIKSGREDAPAFNQYSTTELAELLNCFSYIEITTDRFPVKSTQHSNALSFLYNSIFVPVFNFIPKTLIQSYGHHIVAKVVK